MWRILLKIRGFNVTMPCKMEVARQVDELSPAAHDHGRFQYGSE